MEEWISICYRGTTVRLLVNGVPGAAINIDSSVKQKGPLSPVLFAFYLEVLCRPLLLLADDKMRGVVFGDIQSKAPSYADDFAVVSSSHEEVTRAVQHVRVFESVSGAELN